MSAFDFLDSINAIDRLGGAIYGAFVQQQTGRVIRIDHVENVNAYHYVGMLKRYKIPTWSYRADSKQISFRVRSGQWQWAVDLLTISGAPVQHPARDWATKPGARMPPPWSTRQKRR